MRDRFGDFTHAMSDVDDKRASDTVEVSLTVVVDQPAPFRVRDERVVVLEVAIEDRTFGIAVHRARMYHAFQVKGQRSEVGGRTSEVNEAAL
jgi:hypothetical protein